MITAQSVLKLRNLEKIIFVPCYISPLKQDVINSEAHYRLEMLQLALEDRKNFELSNYEIDKGGISYTIDTIKYMREKYKNIELIIGYDNLIAFEKWYKPDDLFKLCKVIVMKRTVDTSTETNKYFSLVEFVNTPTIEISASDIRERVRSNLSIDYLVPDRVKEYIYRKGLYKKNNKL
ncbi:MAG: nicotinate (nicotinamide) nucleotide adenylyltransferase [Ignavibacteria bacterium RBG_13_36_8]|nr:MAG: nicotinate (nicotinamide) nucleotide adenylyltransferase [Ignavibacteria bacterium RBG_13_36_8]